jgi:ribonuclease Z
MIFARTHPKLAAYTHLVFLASKQVPPATLGDLIAETRQTYSGPLQVGEDLMCFEIGETVSVRQLGNGKLERGELIAGRGRVKDCL